MKRHPPRIIRRPRADARAPDPAREWHFPRGSRLVGAVESSNLKTPVPKPNSDSLSSWKFRIPIAQTKFLSLLSEWENDGQKSPSPTTTRIRDKSQGKCLPPPVKVQVLDLTRGLNAISQDILEETDESFSVQIQKSASIECEICHKLISRPWFPQHERIHLADVERHACHICGAQFTRKGDVKRHQKRVHGKELGLQSDATTESNSSTREILKCQVCQAKFHKRKYYEDHIKIIHPISTSTGTTEGKRTSENGNVTDGIKEVVQSEEHSLIVSQDQLQNNHLDRHEEDEDQNSSNSSPNSEYVEQKSSQDNVQTLIDAVQELIQSHDEGNLVTTPNSNEES
ncbi:GDNF-inducible zinc finger protein 1-like isoform X2 [Tigriopus californicus]|nr:GDNF-inducible zinc finger protein 1-like isoform X2 [Tigriopus californicus]